MLLVDIVMVIPSDLLTVGVALTMAADGRAQASDIVMSLVDEAPHATQIKTAKRGTNPLVSNLFIRVVVLNILEIARRS